MRTLNEEQFLGDVKDHEMRILLDNGVYRHLRFKSTGAHPWNQWFDIVTWPGYLAYSGDMGCYVFSRLNDMFEFFRTRPADEKAKLHINTGYWAEKLEAVDRCGGQASGAREYSEDRLKEQVERRVKEWVQDYDLTKDEEEELRDEVESQVLTFADGSEYIAHGALRDFSAEIGKHTFEFSDTWEWDLREYTGRFVWCCYALAWSVQKYYEAEDVNEHNPSSTSV